MNLLGGFNAVGVRVTTQELAPFWGATLRFSFAFVILAGIAVVTRPRWPRGRALAGVLVYGLLNFALSYAFVYIALVEASAGTAQVILALVPLLTLVLAILHRVERFRWMGLFGSLIAAVGITVIFADQLATASLVSLLALLVAALCIAETGVAVKWFPRVEPVAQNTIGMAVGVAILGGLSLVAGEAWVLPARGSTWLAIGYLSALGSVAVFLLVIYVLHRWSASAASYGFLLLPLVAVPAGAVLLGEQIGLGFLAGGALVLAGVYVGAFARSPVRA